MTIGRPLPLVAVAADFAGLSWSGWAWIANGPENAPAAGDLVIWNRQIGPAGHVALCVGPSDAQDFVSLDQNWYNSSDRGSPGALVTHGYYGVAGWLHPVSGGSPMPAPPFHVNTHPDARWLDQPGGAEMGPAAGLTNMEIVEVIGAPDHFYYRWEGGAWWLRDIDCEPTPPPPPTPPPTTDLEARLAVLETWRAKVMAALSG